MSRPVLVMIRFYFFISSSTSRPLTGFLCLPVGVSWLKSKRQSMRRCWALLHKRSSERARLRGYTGESYGYELFAPLQRMVKVSELNKYLEMGIDTRRGKLFWEGESCEMNSINGREWMKVTQFQDYDQQEWGRRFFIVYFYQNSLLSIILPSVI